MTSASSPGKRLVLMLIRCILPLIQMGIVKLIVHLRVEVHLASNYSISPVRQRVEYIDPVFIVSYQPIPALPRIRRPIDAIRRKIALLTEDRKQSGIFPERIQNAGTYSFDIGGRQLALPVYRRISPAAPGSTARLSPNPDTPWMQSMNPCFRMRSQAASARSIRDSAARLLRRRAVIRRM